MEVQRQKTLEAISNHNCGFYYEHSADIFSKIPGKPVAYWASERSISVYKNTNMDFIAQPRHGLATSDNNRFLKLWYEIDFNMGSLIVRCDKSKKWFPMSKGGGFRRWYGNLDWVINYEDDGKEIKDFAISIYKCSSRTIQNTQFYFQEGLTWSALTSGSFSVRWQEKGALFGSGGYCAFVEDNLKFFVLALLNSKVTDAFIQFVSPTLNYEVGHIKTIPVVLTEKNAAITELSLSSILCSRNDWDSYETSWDFKYHPLVNHINIDTDKPITVENSYKHWKSECEQRFTKLKANEEELNRIFIDIYGLKDELTPEVLDKDITVHRIFDTKEDVPESMKGSAYIRTRRDEIVSLLSYAVGCMFGRYSLDTQGLAYAGGEWDASKYTSFKPVIDNIIPITDEVYLEDDIDIITRLCTWLKVVYSEDTLEENLDFIANALGNKGNTSREIIRNYFLNDFFKDHCQTYSVTGSGKRPIYWLFDSGKQNGFKALIYLHRYNADTVGNLRIDYLHRMQRIYESEIERMQDTVDHVANARDVAAAKKRKEKLQKQLKECREYDEKIAHLALSRIELDLDDGVKVNYRKIQTGVDGKFYEVLADSKNIMSKEK